MIRRTVAAALLVGSLAAACGTDDASGGDGTAPPTDESAPAATDLADEPPASDPPATDPPPTEAPPSIEPAGEVSAIAGVLGVATIEIVTPPSGGGERPVLEWVAVEGAEGYDVVALTEDGEPYWAWVGRTTSVVFGGGDPADDAGHLAIVYGPLTWTVAAFGPDGTVLALSNRTPLAP